jgi:hypothetical protein
MPIYRFEPLIMRLGMVPLIWLTTARFPKVEEQAAPLGLAHFVDLTVLSCPSLHAPLLRDVPLLPDLSPFQLLLIALLALYALGTTPLLATGTLLALHTAVGTLVNSATANVDHNSQIVGYALLAQFLAHLYHQHAVRQSPTPGHAARQLCLDRWRDLARSWAIFFRAPLDPSRPGALTSPISPNSEQARWTHFTISAIAASYVVSAISKLVRSEGRWIENIPNIVLQIRKTNGQAFADTGDHTAAAATNFAIDLTSRDPDLARLLFGAGLGVELFAFLALFGRTWALLVGISLFVLHTLVSQLMSLEFTYNKAALVLLLINIPFWLYHLVLRSLLARRPLTPAP